MISRQELAARVQTATATVYNLTAIGDAVAATKRRIVFFLEAHKIDNVAAIGQRLILYQGSALTTKITEFPVTPVSSGTVTFPPMNQVPNSPDIETPIIVLEASQSIFGSTSGVDASTQSTVQVTMCFYDLEA